MSLRGGIDLGGTKIQAVVAEGDGTVRGEHREPTPVTGGPPDVAAAMADAMRRAPGAAGVAPADLGGGGVGSPGAVDDAAGVVAEAGNLPDWLEPFPLRDV